MRSYDSATGAYLAARGGIVSKTLVWISARNTATNAVEASGLWSGEEDATFTIGGQPRAYRGAGTVLGFEAVSASPGLAVRTYQIRLSAVAPEVLDLIKGYDTRFAPVEIHRAFFDPGSRALVAEPHRVFRGLINGVDFEEGKAGLEASCTVEIVSETRTLTRGLPLKKSHENQYERGNDYFRKYGDISGAVPVYWGELKSAT